MAALGDWTFEIIKRSDTAKGFEAAIESALAWVLVAHIRRLTRPLVTP